MTRTLLGQLSPQASCWSSPSPVALRKVNTHTQIKVQQSRRRSSIQASSSLNPGHAAGTNRTNNSWLPGGLFNGRLALIGLLHSSSASHLPLFASLNVSVTKVSTAGGGGQGPPAGGASGGGGGGGGSGGDGSLPNASAASSANVLNDVASADMVEEVVLLDVGGMKCGGCVGHVKRILEAQPGVTMATVNLATETALVRVLVPRSAKASGGKGSSSALSEHMKALGDGFAQALTTSGFPSHLRDMGGGSSSSLSALLKAKREAKMTRLREVTVNLVVAWGLSALCGLGHLSHVWTAAPTWMHALHSVPLNAAISAAALLGPGRDILTNGFSALVAGRPDMNSLVGLGATASFGVSAVAALLPNLGWKTFFEEPAMLLGFVLIGRALEERAKLQASADMASLQELVPTRARLSLATGGYAEVPAEAVVPGDLLVVLPGDRMPVDGVVVGGRSSVDESALTGEPMPIVKGDGDKVTAGTVNCDGALSVRAEHSGQATVIADIVRLVESAQARTAPIQRVADGVAGQFAYGVMALSAATFAFWALAGTRMFPQVLAAAATGAATGPAASLLLSLQMACNVLVTACPCALGLATPTAVLVGTGAGAKRGLLIRGGDVLEATSHVDTVVFDKTGTLTAGKPQVTAVHAAPEGGMTEVQLLLLAAAVERKTTHPVAMALARAADSQDGCSSSTAVMEGTFQQEPGSGVAGNVGAQKVVVGTLDWLQRHAGGNLQGTVPDPADLGAMQKLPPWGRQQPGASTSSSHNGNSGSNNGNSSHSHQQPSHSGSSTGPGSVQGLGSVQGVGNSHSTVYVSCDGRLVGWIEVADAVRHDAQKTVADLAAHGVRCMMLSGDNAAAAAEVAAAVGIRQEDVFADVKPAGKAARIEKLKGEGHTVAMVGDGVNDTAALAAAHVGIAMGGGVDAASDVAQVVLMGDQLHQVSDAIDLSKRTLNKIRQNLCWAFGYNLIGIPLAAGALLPAYGICLTPSISGALMGFSSLMVVSNSLLLQLEVQHSMGPAGGSQSVQAGTKSVTSSWGTGAGLGSGVAANAAPRGGNGQHVLRGKGAAGNGTVQEQDVQWRSVGVQGQREGGVGGMPLPTPPATA